MNIVYILTNEAMPGLVKLGCTRQDDLNIRIKQLYTTGVPFPFELFYACEVNDDCAQVERKLHDAFDDHRVSRSREFFRIAPQRIRSALSLAAKREIRLGDELFDGLDNPEAKQELEIARKRSRFQFSMIGIRPGTTLQLFRSPEITCTTEDDKNRVNYDGAVASLSDAALRALRSIGIDWPTVSGPFEWSYNGKRLDDIRREIEDEAD